MDEPSSKLVNHSKYTQKKEHKLKEGGSDEVAGIPRGHVRIQLAYSFYIHTWGERAEPWT